MKSFGWIALQIAVFLFGTTGLAHAADARDAFPKRVMFVILENADYSDALAQPFLASLALRGALLTNVTAVAHPSLPNYIALISGSTQGVTTDRPVTLAAAHIGDLLEAKGLRWKVYAEGYPGNCFLGDRLGNYARRHVPFLGFEDVQNDPRRCASIVNDSQLDIDIHSARIPDFSIYVPDMRDDGHDTGVAFADDWLDRRFSTLLGNREFMKNMLLVITFDEGEGPTNHIATIIYGDQVAAGAKSDAPLTHFDLLKLAERTLGLGTLAEGDKDARDIEGIWR